MIKMNCWILFMSNLNLIGRKSQRSSLQGSSFVQNLLLRNSHYSFCHFLRVKKSTVLSITAPHSYIQAFQDNPTPLKCMPSVVLTPLLVLSHTCLCFLHSLDTWTPDPLPFPSSLPTHCDQQCNSISSHFSLLNLYPLTYLMTYTHGHPIWMVHPKFTMRTHSLA